MEVLNEIWAQFAPYVTVGTISTIITSVAIYLMKRVVDKAVGKINTEAITEKAVDNGIKQVKTVSFSQSIQPLVVSELKKVTETANEMVKEELALTENKLNDIIKITACLAKYFDNSIGVSDEAKQELKKAVESALNKPLTEQTITIEEVVKEIANTPVNDDKTQTTNITIER